ncbi:HET domain-containing protein [Cordyceps javanica]|uniref:HET domain-containing protein n=1 Tax=Cordyceps javanica TaxID=43265 RepID=A0A545UPW6_9HYPO|nr:HET domain-containing protein [Cordyceps javanica]
MYFRGVRPENSEIRLLRHRPTSASTTLLDFECTIVSLNFPPPYHAISYSLSSPTGTTPFAVTINGHRCCISGSLHFALAQVHAVGGSDMWLWVHALCVNTDDPNERNWQVAQMQSVFASADSVFFCIGPAANDSDYLFDCLVPWGRQAADAEVYPGHNFFFNDSHKDITLSSFTSQARNFIRSLVNTEEVYAERLHAAISALSRRPNWKRCWIIQELALAKRGVLLCGDKVMQLHHFYAVMRALARVHAWRGEAPPLGDGYVFIPSSANNAMLGADGRVVCIDGHMVCMNSNTTLHWFLTHWASTSEVLNYTGPFYQATDPRDIIFGFLGAASDRASLGLTIDYSKTIRDVYTAATVAMFRADPRQVILELASFPKDVGGLPTWVPDWSRIGRLGIQDPLSKDNSFHLFRAPQTLSHLSILDGHILQRHGFVCGVVRRAFRLVDSSHGMERQASALSSALEHDRAACVEDMLEFVRLYAPDTVYGSAETPETPETRIWRTITADLRRPAALLEGYHECCYMLLHLEPMSARELSAVAIAWIQTFPEARQDDPLQRQVDASTEAAQKNAKELTRNRTLFVTEDGRTGLGPYLTRPGDVVAALVGSTVPVLLRPDDGCLYQYLGQAFVEDMMNGQLDEDEYRNQVFNLV